MVEAVPLKTLRTDIDESVHKTFERLAALHAAGNVSGISVAVTFRDGRSLTFASGCDSRREMLGLMLDGLLDYAGNARTTPV